MKKGIRFTVTAAVLALLIAVVVACGGATPTPTAAPAPAATAAPTTAPAPTTASAPTATAAPTAAPAPTMAAEPKYRLRIAHYSPPTDEPRWLASLEFARIVKEKTNGLVELEIAPAGQLVPVAQIPDALRQGTIDGTFDPDLYFAGQLPVLSWDFVTGLADKATVMKQGRESGILDIEAQEAIKQKMVLLGGYSPDGVNVIVHKSKFFPKPEDIKGAMLRSPGGLLTPAFQDLGAGLASMPSSEVYTAVQRGVADGAISAVSAMHGLKIQEVAPKWTYVPFGVYRVLFIMSEAGWNKLPPDIQAQVKEAVAEAELATVADIMAFDKVLRAKAEGLGAQFLDADMALWGPTMAELTRKYYLRDGGAVGPQVLEMAEKWNQANK